MHLISFVLTLCLMLFFLIHLIRGPFWILNPGGLFFFSDFQWGTPQFAQIFDYGPAHKKQYIFKVVVNGQDFQPTVASDNKKKAKADAATAALQQLGLLPIDPNNPL